MENIGLKGENKKARLTIETYENFSDLNRLFYNLQEYDGVKLEYPPTTIVKAVGFPRVENCYIIFEIGKVALSVAIGVISNRIYDYVKKHKEDKVEINGVKITGNVKKLEIIQIIEKSVEDESTYISVDDERLCNSIKSNLTELLRKKEIWRKNKELEKAVKLGTYLLENIKPNGEASSVLETLENWKGNCTCFVTLGFSLAESVWFRIKNLFYVELPGHAFLRYNDGKIKLNLDINGMGIPDYMYKRIFGLPEDYSFEEKKTEASLSLIFNNGGVELWKLKRYKESIEYFDKALNSDPNSVTTLINKGAALQTLEKDGEAKDCFNKAKEINPNCITGLLSLKTLIDHRKINFKMELSTLLDDRINLRKRPYL